MTEARYKRAPLALYPLVVRQCLKDHRQSGRQQVSFLRYSRIWLIALVSSVLFGSVSARAACIQSGLKQEILLSGKLEFHIFPGPPNFEDVSQGDTPEPTYILRLDSPICLIDEEVFDTQNLTSIHLIVDTPELMGELSEQKGKHITLVLFDFFGRQTAHHHAPVLATVRSVAKALKDTLPTTGAAALKSLIGGWVPIGVSCSALTDYSNDGIIKFSPKNLRFWESECNIKSYQYNNSKITIQTLCFGEGESWKETYTFKILDMKTIQDRNDVIYSKCP